MALRVILVCCLTCSSLLLSGCSARPQARPTASHQRPAYHARAATAPRMAAKNAARVACASVDATGLSEGRKQELFEAFDRSQGREGTDTSGAREFASNATAQPPCEARPE